MYTQELEKVFEKLVKEHERLLHKICSIYARTVVDREDLLQEIIIQLWQAFPRFKGDSKVSTWMYRVGLNTAITGVRKKRTDIKSYAPHEIPDNITDEVISMQYEKQLTDLSAAIERLTDIEKAVVMLYLEERSYEEMEEILGISQGTIRVKMNRIKDKLRQFTKNK